MKTARESFIKADTSEKIKRALAHNVRPESDMCYENGEKVSFKRQDSKRWHGPGTVIGQEGKQIIVRNGGAIVSVHTSRITKLLPTIYED